ncbi:MAG TPA: ABC transporter ATP-binding protein [Bryobacteraceae bacterium]|nr:ABC transporter ATP-binding protein [Bryobacteraceae bacterium]
MRKAALNLCKLRKTYRNTIAVNDLDLTVWQGECFGLLGPNGAGKTTTIEICEGLTAADSGTVEVLGMSWNGRNRQLRERLGIQLQETCLSEKLTVIETLRMFSSFYRRPLDVTDVIALLQLGDKKNARVGILSGGQKQRLALGCALVGDPDLLFLDEPTTGLDPQARHQLWALIERLKQGGRTIVLTTHHMEEAERLCDRVAIMDHGRIIALGSPAELINSAGAEHVIEYSFSGSPATVRMQARELHLALPAILDQVSSQGFRLTDLRTQSATLEDVFMTLTGRSLRDE